MHPSTSGKSFAFDICEEILNALMQGLQDRMWMLDRNLQIVWANRTTREAYGAGIIGEKCHRAFHNRDLPCEILQCRACLVFLDGKSRQYETKLVGRYGQTRWFHFYANPILPDEQGRPSTVLAVGRDISDRKKVEEALRDSEELYRIVLSSISDAVFITDNDGAFTFVCSNTRNIFGLSEDEARQTGNVRSLLGEIPFDPAELNRVGEISNIEWQIRTPDGTERTILINARRVAIRKGTILYCCRDITRRKEAQQEAHRAKLAVEASLNAIGFADLNGIVGYVNDSLVRMWGYQSQDELTGRHLAALAHQADDFHAIIAILEKQGKWRGELRARRKDGAPFTVELSSYRLREDRGTPNCILVSCVDISERKKAEQTLRDSDLMKSEFISTASHELRTPLTAVQGFAEYLLKQPDVDPETRRRCLTVIFEKAQALVRITNDLLDLTRVESGQLICLKKERIDVGKLLGRMVEQIRQTTSCHQLVMHWPEAQVFLTLDVGKIEQVLGNLLSNAVKYSPKGGRITIRGENREPDFLFTISDEGIGMTPDQMNRVFDKFYRADGSNTAIEGIGLGMSITRKIIEEHGGRIWLDSEPGQGTRVFFTLQLEGQER